MKARFAIIAAGTLWCAGLLATTGALAESTPNDSGRPLLQEPAPGAANTTFTGSGARTSGMTAEGGARAKKPKVPSHHHL